MISTDGFEELGEWSESPTDSDSVQAALLRIWRDANKTYSRADGHTGESGGILRTRVANLLAYTTSPEDAEQAEAVLRELALRHPLRSIVFSPAEAPSNGGLGAAVRMFCRPSSGRSVCFEQIHLSAEDENGARLAGLVEQLLVHDLPTLLWCPDSAPSGSSAFQNLAGLADLLIFDSRQFTSALDGLVALSGGSDLSKDQNAIADLNWNRLADWRELIAQFFDHDEAGAALENIRQVEIESGSAGDVAPSAQALLLVGWLGSRLNWRIRSARRAADGLTLQMHRGQVSIGVRIVPAPTKSAGSGVLNAVRIDSGEGTKSQRFCLESEPDAPHASATSEAAGGQSNCRCFALQERSTADLLAEEVEAFGREHALEEAIEFAATIAVRIAAIPASR
jgi:glucose-6-phosphate dehydrogenase assembly protein OpcA